MSVFNVLLYYFLFKFTIIIWFRAKITSSMISIKSPFKFLDSYSKDDRDIFFGREREIEELYQRVFDGKLLLVYGVSGTGKSSLIHCGLANKFMDTDWLPIVIRRSGNIIESLATGIKAASITEQQSKFATPGDFRKGVRSLYLDHYKPIFFLFDQFEELFIFGDKDERNSFIQIVKTLTESDLQCRMIFVMREEYMAWVTEFEKVIPTFFANRVRIEKMSHTNALEAIKEPCKVFNISLEEGFAETLLEKLSPGSTEIELTYLQVFLDRILHLATVNLPPLGGGAGGVATSHERASFTISLLSKVGNVSDLLGSFLDDQISLMENPDIAMTVLKAFVSGKGTKRPANEAETIDNVHSLGKVISPEKVTELLQTFVKLRVLRDKDDHGRYELRHDALAEKIYEKFSLAEKELLEIRQFIENAYQTYLRRKVLLNSDDLNYISNKDSLLNLNDELMTFLKESRKHQAVMKRALMRLITVSVFAFIVLLSILIYTIIRRTNISQSVVNSMESIFQFSDPALRLGVAGLAWKKDPDSPSKEALLKAFDNILRYTGTDTDLIKLKKNFYREYTPVCDSLIFATSTIDDKFIYGHTEDSIVIWNSEGDIFSKFRTWKMPLINLTMSDNDEYLGGVSHDSILTVWDLKGNVQFEKKIRYIERNTKQVFRFTKNNFVLTLSPDHDAILVDLKGNIIQSFDNHKGSVNALDISNDGLFFATASCDSTINIWYLNEDKNIYDFYNKLTSHNDTVWSVDFAGNSRYVISTSADRTVRTTSVNNNISDTYYAWNIGHTGGGYPFLAEFYDSTAITVESFASEYRADKRFCVGIYYGLTEQYANAGEENPDSEICRYDEIIFSPFRNFFAYVSGNGTFLADRKSKFKMVTYHNYCLMKLDGNKPFFSSDGRFVYTICGKRIDSWFIDINTISGIAVSYAEKL